MVKGRHVSYQERMSRFDAGQRLDEETGEWVPR
jgi:hypothetical protein